MKNTIIVLSLMIMISCANQTDKKSINSAVKPDTKIDTGIAVNFINGYVDLNNKQIAINDRLTWINNNKFGTDNFKKIVKKILGKASKDEPLEADPVFNAQDYPDKGFEIVNFDENSGYVILRGIGWHDFKLVIKLVQVDGRTLVDGCGMINIPIDKRMN